MFGYRGQDDSSCEHQSAPFPSQVTTILTQGACEEVGMGAKRDTMHELSNTDICSTALLWLQALVSSQTVHSKDQP